MNVVLPAVVSVLNVLSALLHMLGCYLLVCQYRDGGQDNPQQLFLINLSVSEGILNILQVRSPIQYQMSSVSE